MMMTTKELLAQLARNTDVSGSAFQHIALPPAAVEDLVRQVQHYFSICTVSPCFLIETETDILVTWNMDVAEDLFLVQMEMF